MLTFTTSRKMQTLKHQQMASLHYFFSATAPGTLLRCGCFWERKPGEVSLGWSKWNLGKHEAGQGPVFPHCTSGKSTHSEGRLAEGKLDSGT